MLPFLGVMVAVTPVRLATDAVHVPVALLICLPSLVLLASCMSVLPE